MWSALLHRSNTSRNNYRSTLFHVHWLYTLHTSRSLSGNKPQLHVPPKNISPKNISPFAAPLFSEVNYENWETMTRKRPSEFVQCARSCLQFSRACGIRLGLFCHLCQCQPPLGGGQWNPSFLYAVDRSNTSTTSQNILIIQFLHYLK